MILIDVSHAMDDSLEGKKIPTQSKYQLFEDSDDDKAPVTQMNADEWGGSLIEFEEKSCFGKIWDWFGNCVSCLKGEKKSQTTELNDGEKELFEIESKGDMSPFEEGEDVEGGRISLLEMKEQILLNLLRRERQELQTPIRDLASDVRGDIIGNALENKTWESGSSYRLVREDPLAIEEQRHLWGAFSVLVRKMKEFSPLEEFGKYYQRVISNSWSWLQWLSLPFSTFLAGSTAVAMSPIVLFSLLNDYLEEYLRGDTIEIELLSDYVIVSFFAFSLARMIPLLLEETSGSRGKFTAPKSVKQRFREIVLFLSASISAAFLPLFGFDIQQQHKAATKTEGFGNNEFDEYWFSVTPGQSIQLGLLTWIGVRSVVEKQFRKKNPLHASQFVEAIGSFQSQIDSLPANEIDELYKLFNQRLFPSLKPEREALLTYMTIIKHAQKVELKEWDTQEVVHKEKNDISTVMGYAAGPATGLLIFIFFYSAVESIEGAGTPAATLAGLVTASLGVFSSVFLQKINVKEPLNELLGFITPCFNKRKEILRSLIDFAAWKSAGKRVLETLTNFSAWKTGGKNLFYRGGAIFHTLLTVEAPLLVALTILFPEVIGGGSVLKKITTGIIGTISIPLFFNELVIGTKDVEEQCKKIVHFVPKAFWWAINKFRSTYNIIAYRCGRVALRKCEISAREKKDIVKYALQKTKSATESFSFEMYNAVINLLSEGSIDQGLGAKKD